VHVVAVLLSSVVHRENLVRSMITGDKPGALDAAAPRNARALGVTLAAAVLGFWAWSLPGLDTTGGNLAYTNDAEHSGLAVDDESDDD
jgi:hypothetical protein